jgi:sigma-E factor negative regulatory protein RseC
MTETLAVVVETRAEEAWVEAVFEGGCGACGGDPLESGQDRRCGAASLAELFHARPRRYRVLNSVGAQAGERVVVALAQGSLSRSALALYGVPLGLLLAGAVVGEFSASPGAPADLHAAWGAAAGLGLAAIWVWLFGRRTRGDRRYHPMILRRE